MIVYSEDDDIKSKAVLIEYESLSATTVPNQPQPISSR